MQRRFVFLAVLLLCGACATIVNLKSALRTYHDAQPCCATFNDLSYDMLAMPTDSSFRIDEHSPMFDFGPLGKSYLKSFKLPTSDTTYRLAIRSYVVFDGLQIGPNAAMFFPLVTFLDEEKKPLGTSSRGNLRYIPSTLFDEPNSPPKLEFAILVKPDSRIRYVVVHTSRDLIEFGGLALAALPRIAANSAPIIVPVPSGPDGPRQVPGSPFGDLRILLQPPRT